MATITIKKNKNGTFLDLSKEDFCSRDFFAGFSDFTNQVSTFLSGTSVSLIVPNELKQEETENLNVIKQLKEELNRRNISLKAIVSELDNANIDDESVSSKTKAKKITKTKKEKIEETISEKEVIDTSSLPETLYIQNNLRSGQLIKYPGNVFVLGDVNPSAEIVADGDVIIWGTLRGIVHAGVAGDTNAKVMAMDIKAGQIRIANKLASLNKKSSQLKFNNGNKIPLVAKIENNEIIITRYF